MRILLPVTAIALLFSACNRAHKFHGVVIDAASRAPLEHVSVTDLDHFNVSKHDAATVYTDANGRFSLRYPVRELDANGKVPLIFQRDDYNSRVVFFPDAGDTVLLEKKEAAPGGLSKAR
jgi:5-hydroxyisourate hydrolase-like protein (transthyretin family)